MAEYDEVMAERERLLKLIDKLNIQISNAVILHDNLVEELAFIVAEIGVLEAAASEMGARVHTDVQTLHKHVSKEELDARELLGALRELSEKYFVYKNLSTATKNLTQFNDEYYTRFNFYRGLRRVALGCIMAVDKILITHEKAYEQVERAYLANTDYWLSYAIMAIVLWWNDEHEACERALRKALMMDERKSALLFLFCNLKFGRKETAARWYTYYLNTIHANDVGEEYQYLLGAYLSGAFGEDRALEVEVRAKFDDMFSEITVYDINYHKRIAEARFVATKPHVADFDYFYLPEYCTEATEIRELLDDAGRNGIAARDLEELAASDVPLEDTAEKLEDSIYDLMESMDEEEEALYLKIKYNELVVAARGQVEVAEQAYEERYGKEGPVSLGGLMETWAFTEDDPRIMPEVRRFAIGKLIESIRIGIKNFAESYRTREKERYEITMNDWSFKCNENEISIAQSNYRKHFEKHQIFDYFKDKFVLIWLAMIAVGVVGLVVAAINFPEPFVIVMAALFVVVGGFLLWRQIVNAKATIEKRKEKDLELIEKTLMELGRWREAYREADSEFEALMQVTYLYEA